MGADCGRKSCSGFVGALRGGTSISVLQSCMQRLFRSEGLPEFVLCCQDVISQRLCISERTFLTNQISYKALRKNTLWSQLNMGGFVQLSLRRAWQAEQRVPECSPTLKALPPACVSVMFWCGCRGVDVSVCVCRCELVCLGQGCVCVCPSVCTSVHVCQYVCICVSTCVRESVSMCVAVAVCVCPCPCLHVWVLVFTSVYMIVLVCLYPCVCVCVCPCMFVYL